MALLPVACALSKVEGLTGGFEVAGPHNSATDTIVLPTHVTSLTCSKQESGRVVSDDRSAFWRWVQQVLHGLEQAIDAFRFGLHR